MSSNPKQLKFLESVQESRKKRLDNLTKKREALDNLMNNTRSSYTRYKDRTASAESNYNGDSYTTSLSFYIHSAKNNRYYRQRWGRAYFTIARRRRQVASAAARLSKKITDTSVLFGGCNYERPSRGRLSSIDEAYSPALSTSKSGRRNTPTMKLMSPLEWARHLEESLKQ